MVSESFDVVWSGVRAVFGLYNYLDSYLGLISIFVGFFTAFCMYRFIIRPLAGSGAIDPSSVLRVFKGADSDEARKPEKK